MPAAKNPRPAAKRTHEAIDMNTWMITQIVKAQR
jgi:hypothetical protein